MINGHLLVPISRGPNETDTFLERGIHELTIYARSLSGNRKVGAEIARENPNHEKVLLGDFRAVDFDVELAAEVSPILFVDAGDPPVKLIHGDADKLVTLDNSTSIKTELDKHGVINDLLILQGAGHGFTGAHRIEASTALLAWFSQHLVP